jgi:predicted metalloprotease with PDZ domain
MPKTLTRLAWLACGLLAASLPAAQAGLPPVADTPYPGTLRLVADVTDTAHALIRVHESIPVQPGPLTLLYPQWLPGNHAPRGPIDQLAGLVFSAGGQRVDWLRDPLDVYAFHVEVPPGADTLEADFQVATAVASDRGRVVFTPVMLNLQWNQALLYPAGHAAALINCDASVRLPEGWQAASALPAKVAGGLLHYEPATLETLIDSPLFAGQYVATLDLAPGAAAPVRLDLFAESAGDLAATEAETLVHRALVREAYAALGPPHYDHYDFLVALSEQLGGIGLEHLRSSENTLPPAYLRSWDEAVGRRDLLAHEYTHAWNGKYRRPADLWTPNYNVPMQDSLLWVYEGLTEYYGLVLAARAGLWSPEFAREVFAENAAVYAAKRPGRSWRPLADTTNQPVMNPRRPLSWASWQRSEDYYTEASLLWLGVDARLRELTRGARGLDDFAARFLGASADHGTVSTYRFEDVVRALEAIAHDDWQSFLEARVLAAAAPLDGPQLAGLKLVYDDQPNAAIRDAEKERKSVDLGFGLGLVVGKDAVLGEVVWQGPAYQAGLAAGTTLVAVNGRAYNAELLKDAVLQAETSGTPIELLVRSAEHFRTVQVDYRGGLRYPHLERLPGRPDRLEQILKARVPQPPAAHPAPVGASSGRKQ